MKRIHIGPLDLYGCQETHTRLEPFLDGELPRNEQRRVSFHLVICRHCALVFRFESQLDSKVRSGLSETKPSPEIHSKIHDALRQARDQN